MSTRSFIARKINNQYEGVYCHWDGEPEYNGAILAEHYSDPKKLAELLVHGDISILGPSIGSKHSFEDRWTSGVTTYYGRDRGETDLVAGRKVFDSFDELNEAAEICGAEYLYVFDGRLWLYAERSMQCFGVSDGTPLSALRPLADRLAETAED